MSPDFDEMQSQAIRYAQEMKKKAGAFEPNTIKENNEFNNIHSAFNKRTDSAYNNSGFNIKSIFNVGNKSDSNDNDFLLIFALILLLSHDSGDKLLMLALLYILT